MYPYPSYTVLQALHEEKVQQASERFMQTSSQQPLQQIARSLAHGLGLTFVALGTRLEHFGLEER